MVVNNPRTRTASRPTRTVDVRLGQVLIQARVAQGITRANAAAALKIPERHLQGLEEGDLTVFRADIYARGAFTSYARYLGLHTDTTNREFLRLLSGAREYVPLKVHTPRPWLAAMLTPRIVIALVVSSIGLAISSYVGWQINSFIELPAVTLTEPTTSVITGTEVTVTGQTDPTAKVTINGEQVLTTTQGEFTATLAVQPGLNVLEVAATNAAERTRTVHRDLLVPRTGVDKSQTES